MLQKKCFKHSHIVALMVDVDAHRNAVVTGLLTNHIDPGECCSVINISSPCKRSQKADFELGGFITRSKLYIAHCHLFDSISKILIIADKGEISL